jgi:adenylyltransferase and sulfurtransferase
MLVSIFSARRPYIPTPSPDVLIVQYRLNPNVRVNRHPSHLEPQSALQLLRPYDVVLDCTDNPQSRYLISDVCVLLRIPLVSASALRTDGQLMVLNNPSLPPGESSGGPCYRCVFPKPPPPDSVVSCGEGGILGPVVGVMGVLQALETIKLIISRSPNTRSTLDGGSSRSHEPGGKQAMDGIDKEDGIDGGSFFSTASSSPPPSPPTPTLLIFSATSNSPFRTIRLRSRRPNCSACSSQATITTQSLTSGSLDYAQFCGILNPVNILAPTDRIRASQFARFIRASRDAETDHIKRNGHVLIDVRDRTQFGICQIPESINLPFADLMEVGRWSAKREDDDGKSEVFSLPGALRDLPKEDDIVVVCRFGNDSQVAVKKLRELGMGEGRGLVDIDGGLRAWRAEVDPMFPEY